jgi:hypothetical protein
MKKGFSLIDIIVIICIILLLGIIIVIPFVDIDYCNYCSDFNKSRDK